MNTGAIPADFPLLDAVKIRNELSTSLANSLVISVRRETASTNSDISALPVHEQHGQVVLAEHQTAGRGRHGRKWHSPFASNLYLSLGWRFATSVEDLGCLSLATGVAITRALARCGVTGTKLKWPNDIKLEGKKLAGILIEVSGDVNGPSQAVIGVGINVNMPEALRIDQPWIDLSGLENPPGRNRLAAAVIEHLVIVMGQFASRGFAPFEDEWAQLDSLHGRAVTVYQGSVRHHGVARGLSATGGLLVRLTDGIHEFHSGDVSVRGE